MSGKMFLEKFQERRKKHGDVGSPIGVSRWIKKKQLLSTTPLSFLLLPCLCSVTLRSPPLVATMLTLAAVPFLLWRPVSFLNGSKRTPSSLKSVCQAFVFHSNIKIQNKLMSEFDLRGRWDHIYFGPLWSWFCSTGMLGKSFWNLICVSALTPYVKSGPVGPSFLGFSFYRY